MASGLSGGSSASAFENDRARVISVETQHGPIRAVGIECVKRQLAVDVILSLEPGLDGLANAALLSADEMDLTHASHLSNGMLKRERCGMLEDFGGTPILMIGWDRQRIYRHGCSP